MANVLKLKRRTADATAPTTANLADGEVAFNTFSRKIYMREGSNIVDMMSDKVLKTGDTFTGPVTIAANGAGAAVNSLVITDNNTGVNALTYISIGTESTVQGFIGAYGTAFNLPGFQGRLGISAPGAGIHYAASGGSADHIWSTGGSFLEKMRLSSAGNLTLQGDITAYRPGSPTTGAIFLNNTNTRYLYNDGTNYHLGGTGGLIVGGGAVWTDATFNPALKQNVNATLTTLIGSPWSTNAVPVGVGATGMSQITMNVNQFIARGSTGNAVAKGITDAALAAVAGMVGKTAYTPTIVGSATPGTGTYTVQTGFYCQFGPITFFKATVGISGHTGAGTARITLPVAAANDVCNQPISVGILDNFTTGATTQINVDVLANTNHARILGLPLGGGTTAGQALDTAFSIQIAGWYFHQ